MRPAYPRLAAGPRPPADAGTRPRPPTVARGLPDFADLVVKHGPAVERISAVKDAAGRPRRPVPRDIPRRLAPFFRGIPAAPPDPARRGQGSGFIVSADGSS